MCVYTGVYRHISISLCNVITFIPLGWGVGDKEEEERLMFEKEGRREEGDKEKHKTH